MQRRDILCIELRMLASFRGNDFGAPLHAPCEHV